MELEELPPSRYFRLYSVVRFDGKDYIVWPTKRGSRWQLLTDNMRNRLIDEGIEALYLKTHEIKKIIQKINNQSNKGMINDGQYYTSFSSKKKWINLSQQKLNNITGKESSGKGKTKTNQEESGSNSRSNSRSGREKTKTDR